LWCTRIRAFIAKLLLDLGNRKLFYSINKTIMMSSLHSRDFLARRTCVPIVYKDTTVKDITNVRKIEHFVEHSASNTAPISWKPCLLVAKPATDAMIVLDNFSANVAINISSKIVNKETSPKPQCVKLLGAVKHASN